MQFTTWFTTTNALIILGVALLPVSLIPAANATGPVNLEFTVPEPGNGSSFNSSERARWYVHSKGETRNQATIGLTVGTAGTSTLMGII
jgi:hypothetical protein